MGKPSRSAVQRTLSILRDCGDVTVSSWYDFYAKKRKDVWGLADLLFVSPGIRATVYVQVTTHGGISSHKKKIRESEFSQKLRAAGNHIWLLAYTKYFRYFQYDVGNFYEHQTLGSLLRASRFDN